MSRQRRAILAVGVVLLVCGLFALRFPVFLDEFDRWGFQIRCGSAVAESAGFDVVDRCHAAVAVRRAWAIPMAAVGVLLLSALLLRPQRGRQAKAGAQTIPLKVSPTRLRATSPRRAGA
jgi:H+/Cl- antiporter ClcA